MPYKHHKFSKLKPITGNFWEKKNATIKRFHFIYLAKDQCNGNYINISSPK